MKQSNKNSLPVQTHGKRPGVKSLGVLLLAALIVPLAAAQADTWSFKLFGAPNALNKNSPKFESIRMKGNGTFDPALGVVAASGSYTLYNAFDHPNGPIIYGRWHSTGFISFTWEVEPGTSRKVPVLKMSINTEDPLSGPGELWVMLDGIAGPIVANEPYIIPPGGSGGGARFHRNSHESFYPPPFPPGTADENTDDAD